MFLSRSAEFGCTSGSSLYHLMVDTLGSESVVIDRRPAAMVH